MYADGAVRHVLSLTQEAYRYTLGAFDNRLKVGRMLKDTLEELSPRDAHVLCSGRLFVSVSKMKHLNFAKPGTMFRNEIISQFHSRERLIETLLCRSYIPVFSSTDNSIVDKEITMDIFFTNNLPQVDESTILVCPLSGSSDISLEDPPGADPESFTLSNNNFRVSWENLCRLTRSFFPASPEQLAEYYHAGHDDALRFLLRHRKEHQIFSRRNADDSEEVKEPDDGQKICHNCRSHVFEAKAHSTYSLDTTYEAGQRVSPLVLWAPVHVVKLLPVFFNIAMALRRFGCRSIGVPGDAQGTDAVKMACPASLKNETVYNITCVIQTNNSIFKNECASTPTDVGFSLVIGSDQTRVCNVRYEPVSGDCSTSPAAGKCGCIKREGKTLTYLFKYIADPKDKDRRLLCRLCAGGGKTDPKPNENCDTLNFRGDPGGGSASMFWGIIGGVSAGVFLIAMYIAAFIFYRKARAGQSSSDKAAVDTVHPPSVQAEPANVEPGSAPVFHHAVAPTYRPVPETLEESEESIASTMTSSMSQMSDSAINGAVLDASQDTSQ
ncbi:hypothetical protein ACOMHN_021238 [Nucella lapillus]